MYLGEPVNKSVRSSKAKAKRIHQLDRSDGNLHRALLDVYTCYNIARHWKDLTPTERIMVESGWTDSVLRLLSIGNNTVMRSLRYRLREQTPEEDEETNTV
jgi:hypothetical protein